jgi:hypothetical protein
MNANKPICERKKKKTYLFVELMSLWNFGFLSLLRLRSNSVCNTAGRDRLKKVQSVEQSFPPPHNAKPKDRHYAGFRCHFEMPTFFASGLISDAYKVIVNCVF